MLDINDLTAVAAAIDACGYPTVQCAWNRICKDLVEAQKPPTNNAKDEICSNFICDYCSKDQYTCEQQFQPLIRSGACFVGRKLSPVA